MSDIKLNTDTLRYYGNQLISISGRVVDVNLKLKSLYWSVPLVDLGKLLRADMLADFNASLIGAANYCYGTADEFDNLETKLCSQNPLDFNKPPLAGIQEFIYDVGLLVGAATLESIELLESAWEGYKKAADDVAKWLRDNASSIITIVAAVATIAVAVALIASGGGLAIGVGILIGLFALNDLHEGIAQIATQDQDQHGFLENLSRQWFGDDAGSRIYAIADLGVAFAGLVVAPQSFLSKSKYLVGFEKGASKLAGVPKRIKDIKATTALRSLSQSTYGKVVGKIGSTATGQNAITAGREISKVFEGVHKYDTAKSHLEDVNTILFGENVADKVSDFIGTVEKNVIKSNIASPLTLAPGL